MIFTNTENPECNCVVCQNDLDQCIGLECENKIKAKKMTNKDKLIEIYKRKEYHIYTDGFKNDGSIETYRNKEIISFVKYFTRLLAYGPNDAEDIKDGHNEIVLLTEIILNDDINNMEKCKNIDEAIDHLLNVKSDWTVCWTAKEIFSYVLEQTYNKKPLDKKYWG